MIRLLLILLFPAISFSQGAQNIELLDHWTEDTLVVNSSNVRYNECFGYEQDGIEYAIAGSTEGTHFFEITESGMLKSADFVEGRYNSSLVVHRDFATFGKYGYAVCDEGKSSLQIIDLSYLPDSVHVVGDNDTVFARVHNIFIDTTNALLYACSIAPKMNDVILGMQSMQVFSLADPENPALLYTGPSDIVEVHDAYVRNNIAYLNCGFDGLRVYDFSNPTAPVFLQNLSIYQEQGYNHQGWLTPDGQTYIFGDETNGKKLKKCSVANNHQVTIDTYFGTNSENNSVPHNIVLSNDFAYVAYYNEGLRIYDLRSQVPTEVAYYDTYPKEEPLFKMKGAWGIYPSFTSGRILVSDRVYGVFLFDFREDIFSSTPTEELSIYPNPSATGTSITLQLDDKTISDFELSIYDYAGRIISHEHVLQMSYVEVNALLQAGAYTARVNYLDYLGDEITLIKKFVVY